MGKPVSDNLESIQQLLKKIRDLESTDNYNASFSSPQNGIPGLTEMTIDEVLKLQDEQIKKGAESSAVGAYQFLRKVLLEEKEKAGLSGTELFTAELQDSLIKNRLSRFRNLDGYLSGDIDELTFSKNLSKEFASFPDPDTGASYYDGDGLNKSLTAPDEVFSLLRSVKEQSQPKESKNLLNKKPLILEQDFNTKQTLINNNEGYQAQPVQDNTNIQQRQVPSELNFNSKPSLDSLLSNKTTPNQLKLGGNLTNQNTMNEINMFNEGGSHEANPLGGIPQGMGQNDQMSTVEEGEGRMGDMIYSDRIPLTEEAIVAVGLPKKFAGKTPAQALAEIEKTFKDRGDKSAQETKKDFADKIAQAQEMIKEQQAQIDQSMAANSQEIPDQMGGEIPQGMEEFMQPEQGGLPMEQDARLQTGMQEQPQMFRNGGRLNRYFGGGPIDVNMQSEDMSGINFGQGGSPGMNAYLGAASTALDFGNQIFGKSGVDTSGKTDYQERFQSGAGIASNSLKGAAAGTAIMPGIGTAIGAGVGAITGIIGGNKKRKDLVTAERNNALVGNSQMRSDFAYGGKINKFSGGGDKNKSYYPDDHLFPQRPIANSVNEGIAPQGHTPFPIKFENKNSLKPIVPTINPSMQINFPNQGYYSTLDGETHGKNPSSIISPENLKKAGRIGNSLLRGAPVGMNLLQLKNAGKYDTVNAIKNTKRFNPQYIDEKSLQNIADQSMNKTINSVSEMGGSRGQMISNIKDIGKNRAETLSKSYLDSRYKNIQTDTFAQQFDNQNTEANIARQIGAEDKTAMNKGAAATNKSRLLAQIGNDLGNIGKENMYKEIAKITGYTWLGDFIRRNPNASKEELIAEAQKHTGGGQSTTEEPTNNAYGGKLKLKRY